MATYSATTTYDNYKIRLDVYESDPNVSSNTSKVNWAAYIVNGGSNFAISSFHYKVTINGSTVADSTGYCDTRDVSISDGAHYLNSGNITVAHNDDGTKTVNCFIECSGRSNGHGPGPGSASGNLVLEKIARQSTINSFTGNDIKGNFSATYTAQSASYENRLRISIPGVRALQTFNNYVSGANVKLSDSAIQSIKNYTSAKTIVLGGVIETWAGNTKVGESSELTTTCAIKKPARIRINGAWKEAVPYVRVSGQWKEATPYTRVSGVWKEES